MKKKIIQPRIKKNKDKIKKHINKKDGIWLAVFGSIATLLSYNIIKVFAWAISFLAAVLQVSESAFSNKLMFVSTMALICSWLIFKFMISILAELITRCIKIIKGEDK